PSTIARNSKDVPLVYKRLVLSRNNAFEALPPTEHEAFFECSQDNYHEPIFEDEEFSVQGILGNDAIGTTGLVTCDGLLRDMGVNQFIIDNQINVKNHHSLRKQNFERYCKAGSAYTKRNLNYSSDRPDTFRGLLDTLAENMGNPTASRIPLHPNLLFYSLAWAPVEELYRIKSAVIPS
ncbi:hypothetical protein MMC29_003148, partial [Sticta canariensis]|nr:hypothetical protein [Sticta canariensis]